MVAAAYPRFEVNDVVHRTWSEMLSDLDYAAVNVALKRHIACEKFPPTIADIRRRATPSNDTTGAEAWGALMEAVRRHGYYHEAEGLASLPPMVASVARHIGWREINMCDEVSVLRGQFLRMFAQVEERQVREQQLPQGLRPKALSEPEVPLSAMPEDVQRTIERMKAGVG